MSTLDLKHKKNLSKNNKRTSESQILKRTFKNAKFICLMDKRGVYLKKLVQQVSWSWMQQGEETAKESTWLHVRSMSKHRILIDSSGNWTFPTALDGPLFWFNFQKHNASFQRGPGWGLKTAGLCVKVTHAYINTCWKFGHIFKLERGRKQNGGLSEILPFNIFMCGRRHGSPMRPSDFPTTTEVLLRAGNPKSQGTEVGQRRAATILWFRYKSLWRCKV